MKHELVKFISIDIFQFFYLPKNVCLTPTGMFLLIFLKELQYTMWNKDFPNT